MVDALNAVNGESFEILNAANLGEASGAADDYYANEGVRFVYTPELRENRGSGSVFELPPEEILPSGQEVWAAWEVMLDKLLSEA